MSEKKPNERMAHEWAAKVDPSWSTREQAAALSIRAHVPKPPAPLADELRRVAGEVGRRGLNSFKYQLKSLADRADEMEERTRQAESYAGKYHDAIQQRDVARTEVERLKDSAKEWQRLYLREVFRNAPTIAMDGATVGWKTPESRSMSSWVQELVDMSKQLCGAQYPSEPDAPKPADVPASPQAHLAEVAKRSKRDYGSPKLTPADVPEGEPWEVCDELGRAVGVRYARRWVLIRLRDATARYRTNAEVTLVSRLVRETRRVIDRAEDLDALPVGSVVLDRDGDAWQKIEGGSWNIGIEERSASYLIYNYGPVTVIHVPEVKPDGGSAD